MGSNVNPFYMRNLDISPLTNQYLSIAGYAYDNIVRSTGVTGGFIGYVIVMRTAYNNIQWYKYIDESDSAFNEVAFSPNDQVLVAS